VERPALEVVAAPAAALVKRYPVLK